MKKQKTISTTICGTAVAAVWLGGLLVAPSHAETCVGKGPEICVDFIGGGDPVFPDDFTVGFKDPANPDVALKQGSLAWQVRSRVGPPPDDVPANIGDITLNPAVSADDFGVAIGNGANPGAVNVGSIVLEAGGWKGHSSITGGEITGNLGTGGLTVVQAGGSGGEVDFTIGGDATGDIVAPVISRTLWVQGDLSANITVSHEVRGGLLRVSGDVTSGSVIQVADMVTDPGSGVHSELRFGESTSANFAGGLVLQSGLRVNQSIELHAALDGSVDFNNRDIAGTFTLVAGGSGTLLNGGQVINGGEVWLADNGFTYSGTATFASIAAGGQVIVGSTFNSPAGNLNGHINCGNVAGAIKTGWLLVRLLNTTYPLTYVPGTINVGSLTESGGIRITNECEGDILVTGSISQGAGIKILGSLAGSAEIEVRGMFDGYIHIRNETATDTLIRLLGIDDHGRVLINEGKQNFDANGTIRVAPFLYPEPPPLPDVTFDGWIKIRNGSGAGGDLNGAITVFGCPATEYSPATGHTLDICLCGGGGASNVDIEQDGCLRKVDWDCLGVCP